MIAFNLLLPPNLIALTIAVTTPSDAITNKMLAIGSEASLKNCLLICSLNNVMKGARLESMLAL